MDKKQALGRLKEAQAMIAEVRSGAELAPNEAMRLGQTLANLNLLVFQWEREIAKKEAHPP